MGVSGQRHDPSALTSGKKSGTHLTGRSTGLEAGLDTEAKEKSFASNRNQTPLVQCVVKPLYLLRAISGTCNYYSTKSVFDYAFFNENPSQCLQDFFPQKMDFSVCSMHAISAINFHLNL
jgi:hypothetical protein